jgi:hypothetical protein
MSFTVAPLTTAVMGSVSDRFSGTASGVNNAVSRIANVFAYAIFGALAVLFFSGALADHVSNLPISASEKQAIMAQAPDLGNAKVPATITGENKVIVEKYYHEGFIAAYSKIMKISAGLGFLGALMAFVFIKNTAVEKGNAP